MLSQIRAGRKFNSEVQCGMFGWILDKNKYIDSNSVLTVQSDSSPWLIRDRPVFVSEFWQVHHGNVRC